MPGLQSPEGGQHLDRRWPASRYGSATASPTRIVPPSSHIRAQPAAVDEVAQDARVGEALEVGARLAQAAADALGLADAEAPADERVEVDAAGDDVAARLGGRQAELVYDLALDQREVVAVG